MQRPCAYVDKNTANVQRVVNNGISEGKEFSNDIRPAHRLKVQVWQQSFLV